jgi:hypothetical protein
VRNTLGVGIPERVAMELGTHKNRRIFAWYNIVGNEHTAAATEDCTVIWRLRLRRLKCLQSGAKPAADSVVSESAL